MFFSDSYPTPSLPPLSRPHRVINFDGFSYQREQTKLNTTEQFKLEKEQSSIKTFAHIIRTFFQKVIYYFKSQTFLFCLDIVASYERSRVQDLNQFDCGELDELIKISKKL